jgi:hypothetical protein
MGSSQESKVDVVMKDIARTDAKTVPYVMKRLRICVIVRLFAYAEPFQNAKTVANSVHDIGVEKTHQNNHRNKTNISSKLRPLRKSRRRNLKLSTINIHCSQLAPSFHSVIPQMQHLQKYVSNKKLSPHRVMRREVKIRHISGGSWMRLPR